MELLALNPADNRLLNEAASLVIHLRSWASDGENVAYPLEDAADMIEKLSARMMDMDNDLHPSSDE